MSFVETPSGTTALAPESKESASGIASTREISIAHSPDSDDAFMFYALATNKVRVPGLRFTHKLCDIETLNQKAREGEGVYDVTAISFHAYPYIQDNYALLPSGGSVGDGYGPMIVATQGFSPSEIKRKKIAIPGTLTTAYLALRLFAPGIETEVVPFDQIIPQVVAGNYEAGLIIHEGQLTYAKAGLQRIVDLGKWWLKVTGLPLPLGGNAIQAQSGTGVDGKSIRRPARQHSVRARPSRRGPGLRHAIRPRRRSSAGRQICGHVRQRAHPGLRAGWTRSRAPPAGHGTQSRNYSARGESGVCLEERFWLWLLASGFWPKLQRCEI